ncbi:MAG: hypothetical protein NVSMB32_18890 [Actinomycetota bacterium]
MSAFIVCATHIDALVSAGLILVRPSGPPPWYHPGNHHRAPGAELPAGNRLYAQDVQLAAERCRCLGDENATEVGAMLVAANRDPVNFPYNEGEIEQPYPSRRCLVTPTRSSS